VPAVAAGIGAACLNGVDEQEWHNGCICFSKDRYGGKLKGRYISRAGTSLLTVQLGCFAFDGRPLGPGEGTVTRKVVAWCPKKTRFDGIAPATVKLTDAHVLVAAGNGIGAQENLQWIHRLAQCLPNAAVAGSRLVCDRGWLSYDRQVGVTGATVAPALYIACGISGASQHLAGMRGSGFVVSINSDPRAPMGFETDLRIVEDLTTFIPRVLELLEKRQRTPQLEKS
jgi:electron transfer flavoprotein alpha subunit